jgi:hypothetical protein
MRNGVSFSVTAVRQTQHHGFRDRKPVPKLRFNLSACALKCDVINMSAIADKAIAGSDPQRAQDGGESREEQE